MKTYLFFKIQSYKQCSSLYVRYNIEVYYLSGWKNYLEYLDQSQYSVKIQSKNLQPSKPISEPARFRIRKLNYELWPFQIKVLKKIIGNTLILGLPTGLGKTFIAGAYLKEASRDKAIRVLFLTPSIPLGVQQTFFARDKLNIESYFISGGISPSERQRLKVWNSSFIVATPQTVANDFLSPFSSIIKRAKKTENPVELLKEAFTDAYFTLPFDVIVADECQGYIGETDGYSLLLTAKACGCQILALSATPQMHAPRRLNELKKIFDNIEIISIEDPEIKKYVPERVLSLVRIFPSKDLLTVYTQLGKVIQNYEKRVNAIYGSGHARRFCKNHPLCIRLLALRMMKLRLVEDGASSVVRYSSWQIKELRHPLEEFGGKSVYDLYKRILKESFNHKLFAAVQLLEKVLYKKAIVFIESVQGAKQLGTILHKKYGVEKVAVLVGRGNMSMEQQASSLLQFKDEAKILVCTSVGEEGLDIPVADIEIWTGPPSNPKKWIQRFGRILRQPGDKEYATTYALVTLRTHERRKLLSVKKKTEEIYGFTQKLIIKPYVKPLPKGQKALVKFVDKP